jgi:hypothetical protein
MAVITVIFFKCPKTGTLLTRISWKLNCFFMPLSCLVKCTLYISSFSVKFLILTIVYANKEKYPLDYKHWFKNLFWIRVITKLPNSKQSYKGKVKTHKYINRQNQSTTGKLWKLGTGISKENHLFISMIIIKKKLEGLGNRTSLYLSFPDTRQQATT